MEQPLKSEAKKYGLILGVTLAIMTFAAYKINLDLFVNTTYGLLIYAIVALLLKDKSITELTLVYKNMHMSNQEIDKMVGIVKSQNLYSLKNCFTGMVTSYLLPLSIIGLLIAAVMKKK